PDLRVGCIETQVCWVPGFLEQLDDNYWRNRHWGDIKLKYLPSEYWKRNFYVTFILDHFGVQNRHAVGVDTMQWSSDYPHQGNDWPYSRKVIQTMFAGVPEDERRKILAENAARTYGLIA